MDVNSGIVLVISSQIDFNKGIEVINFIDFAFP